MKILKENPKLSISVIITLVVEVYSLVSSNAELLGIESNTLAKISVIVSMISLVWKQVKPEESLFTMAYKSIGGGGIMELSLHREAEADEKDYKRICAIYNIII